MDRDQKTINQDAINRSEWERAANWVSVFGTYSSARDSRWFVPNRLAGINGANIVPNTARWPGRIAVAALLFLILGLRFSKSSRGHCLRSGVDSVEHYRLCRMLRRCF